MPVNGAAMAVFMEMTAEAHVEGRNSSKSAPPAKRSGSNEAIVRVLNVRRDPLENELRVCLFCPYIEILVIDLIYEPRMMCGLLLVCY
jgi:hypothetical protein